MENKQSAELLEALNKVKNIFQDLIEQEIIAINGIEFIVREEVEAHELLDNNNKSFTDPQFASGFSFRRCRRVNGRWVCPRP